MNFGKKAMRSVAFAFAIFAVPMIVAPQANVAFADSAVKIVSRRSGSFMKGPVICSIRAMRLRSVLGWMYSSRADSVMLQSVDRSTRRIRR